MAAHANVPLVSPRAEVGRDREELPRPHLEGYGDTDHERVELQDALDDGRALRVVVVGHELGMEAGAGHRRRQVPERPVLLVLGADESDWLRHDAYSRDYRRVKSYLLRRR